MFIAAVSVLWRIGTTQTQEMGNVIARMVGNASSPENWQPNINFSDAEYVGSESYNVNDLNRPHKVQLQDMILNYAVPLLCVTALGKCFSNYSDW